MLSKDLQDLLDRFARGPSLLREAVSGLDAGIAGRPPPGDDWSVRDIVVHLADAELVRAVRIRAILAEDEPALITFDERLWKRRLQYLWRSIESSISLFEQTRYTTAEILRHAGKDAWERTGIHPERGRMTVRELIVAGIDHVTEHAEQIRAARAAFS